MRSAPVHLVFGATGQVGFDLMRELAPTGRVIGLSRPGVDLERLDTVRDAIRSHRPTMIWNAAAATAVDSLEGDPALAFRVNATSLGVMAEESKRIGGFLVHFSTDYVFDGSKAGPYVEEDQPRPLNVYGRSKLAGEVAVQQAGGRHLILRTSWVYSQRGRNFYRAIVARGVNPGVIRVVDDQIGAPTWSKDLASACVVIAPILANEGVSAGLFHLTGAGHCSWYRFASAIRDARVAAGAVWRAELKGVSTAEYGSPVLRPRNSVLSSQSFSRTFNLRLPAWPHSLQALVAHR